MIYCITQTVVFYSDLLYYTDRCILLCRWHTEEECAVLSGLADLPPHQPTWLPILRAALAHDNRIAILQGMENTSLSQTQVLTSLGVDQEKAARLHSVLTANTFRRGSGRCLCPMMAMVNHSCVPNCRVHWEQDDKLVLTAKKKIPAGEELTITYCSSLLGTYSRQKKLLSSKGFLCVCERCQDPGEGGTMMGGLVCTRCHQGYLLPHIQEEGNIAWICECGFQANTDKVQLLFNLLK